MWWRSDVLAFCCGALRSPPLEAPAAAEDDDDDDAELVAAAAADEDSTRDEEDPARSATPDWLKDAGAALGLPG